MRNPAMRPMPLADLVERLKENPSAFGGYWRVYCCTCERYFDDIWPDRAGILCGQCGEPLVALVARETEE